MAGPEMLQPVIEVLEERGEEFLDFLRKIMAGAKDAGKEDAALDANVDASSADANDSRDGTEIEVAAAESAFEEAQKIADDLRRQAADYPKSFAECAEYLRKTRSLTFDLVKALEAIPDEAYVEIGGLDETGGSSKKDIFIAQLRWEMVKLNIIELSLNANPDGSERGALVKELKDAGSKLEFLIDSNKSLLGEPKGTV